MVLEDAMPVFVLTDTTRPLGITKSALERRGALAVSTASRTNARVKGVN
jgi:hypothetical protein